MTTIAVIGAGNIGRTLGNAWGTAGHDVIYGSRTPTPPETAEITDALAAADVVLLAIPGAAVDGLLSEHGRELDGKLVIDATNRIGADQMHNAEALAQHAPRARVVRAFNTLGWEVFADPGD